MNVSLDPRLKIRLQMVADRQRRVRLWWRLGICWAVAALLGAVVIAIQRETGWASSLSLPVVAVLGIVASIICFFRQSRVAADWAELARRIESRHLNLEGRLLTAIDLPVEPTAELSYLQDRVVQETVLHGQHHDWEEAIPRSWLGLAQVGHWVALIAFVSVLWGLRTTRGHGLLGSVSEVAVTVSPGDTSLERGSSLVVLARFDAALPPSVDLVISSPAAAAQHIPLARSLADPVFGGSVPEVATNLAYRVEYSGKRTREFNVTVFEYPRLERADADLRFPTYTEQPPKHIENTKRLTAVEDSRLDLTLQLNKPVTSARLVPRDQDRAAIPLLVETNRAVAAIKDFHLEKSQSYSLQLIDAEGRTNKTSAQFVFDVVSNRTPELHLTAPPGDVRPSPLEEITFEGTVWDDFGVKAYGLAYTMAGQETKFVELGKGVAAREKRPFKQMLRLEELGVQPDSLVAWYVWADDLGPDGQIRRTSGDLYFGEVRPFEEVFREAQSESGGGQSGGPSESPTGKLAELQKQIISATWRLQRQRPTSAKPQSRVSGGERNDRLAFITERTSRTIYSSVLKRSSPRPMALAQVSQEQASPDSGVRRTRLRGISAQPTNTPPTLASDAMVVRDSQAQALEQAQEASERQNDPRTSVLWSTAKAEMEKALERLQSSTNTSASFGEALAAEQSAYQALLKLQQHEYQVSRGQNRNQQGGGGRQEQLQRQLDQMEMTQADNRYETQRQAQSPQTPQRREQFQVQNRLQELARRQQDVNDRLKELQTALQEARTEAERQDIQRRLKRLQEEEQQMLADVDELRQRMDRAENQSQMSQQRQQLDQTREDVQRAADAAAQGTPSQALASGTRAQRQLQELRDQMRKENSNQFAEDLRDMRGQARELAQKQEEILRQMRAENPAGPRRLADTTDAKELVTALNRQKERATNLVEHATQISQQAEEGEPLLSRQLYETVRKYTQDTAKGVKDAQDELANRGQLSRGMYERLKESSEPESSRLLDLSAGLLQEGLGQPAVEVSQRARTALDDLRRGVELAAGSVLGDDTESLRMAQKELEQLMDQLQKEMAENDEGPGTNANARQIAGSGASATPSKPADQTSPTAPRPGGDEAPSDNKSEAQAQAAGASQNGQASSQNPGQAQSQEQSEQTAKAGGSQSGQAGNQSGQDGQPSAAQPGRNGQTTQNGRQRSGAARSGQQNSQDSGANSEGGGRGDFTRIFDESGGLPAGPILTGENFTPWSDRLLDVEEMIELPELRNQVAAARDRARRMRQEFRRDQKKPDWDVVRLQVVTPLVEVRDRIADELARRESNENLVPIDRDPVPARYSELVRRYYEELGKEK